MFYHIVLIFLFDIEKSTNLLLITKARDVSLKQESKEGGNPIGLIKAH